MQESLRVHVTPGHPCQEVLVLSSNFRLCILGTQGKRMRNGEAVNQALPSGVLDLLVKEDKLLESG